MSSWTPDQFAYSNSPRKRVRPKVCLPGAAESRPRDFRFAPESDCDSILLAAFWAKRSRIVFPCHLKRSLENMLSGPSMRGLCLLGALMSSPLLIDAQEQPPLYLMPVPVSVQIGTGRLLVDSRFSVASTGYTEPRLDRAIERFLLQLSRQTAIPLSRKPGDSSKASLVIHTEHAGKEIQELGEDESYLLEVTATGAKLSALTPLGTLHGLETFLQLVEVSPEGFAAPAVTINDKPRFPWRGLMIDSARHFVPLDVLKRNIDGLEA